MRDQIAKEPSHIDNASNCVTRERERKRGGGLSAIG